jgi:hypothetical protein
MTTFFAYAHLRPDLTPFYIGKGSGRRATDFVNGRNRHHRNIVAKYGRKNIIVEVMPCASEAEAFLREQLAIKALRASGVRLCNQSDGGEGASGAIRSPETRAKMAAAKIGKQYCLGKKRSPESIAKHVARMIGNKYSLGKKRSSESRARMSAIMQGKNTNTGWKHSAATREKMVRSALLREQRKREQRG